MAKAECYRNCPFVILGGTDCDGKFAHIVGVGCEDETATEAIEKLERERPEIIEALFNLRS